MQPLPDTVWVITYEGDTEIFFCQAHANVVWQASVKALFNPDGSRAN